MSQKGRSFPEPDPILRDQETFCVFSVFEQQCLEGHSNSLTDLFSGQVYLVGFVNIHTDFRVRADQSPACDI